MAGVLVAPDIRLEAALRYAAYGWPLAPAFWITPQGQCACRKDCASPGKHPITPRGLHDATEDERQLRAWWEERPHANLLINHAPSAPDTGRPAASERHCPPIVIQWRGARVQGRSGSAAG